MQQLLNNLPIFLLVLVRLTSFFVTTPLFSYRTIPTQFKIGISVFISLIITMTMKTHAIDINGEFVLLVLKEAIVGLSIGFVAGLLFYAIQVAGAFIDLQMGLAIANVIDPQSGTSSPLTGQFYYVMALLFLLTVNGHYLLLNGIFYSYQLVPVDQLAIHIGKGVLVEYVVKLFVEMFMIALQMAIPIVGSLFLVDVGLGVIARTVPQVNVFVVGLPLKIIVSFLIMLLVIPIYIMVIQQIVNGLDQTMKTFMNLLGSA